MTQQWTYLLAPSFRFKPNGGPIGLGNLIADPLRPHRALTTVDEAKLKSTYPRIETVTEQGRETSHSTGGEVSMAVWPNFCKL
jgi:hypothetical protein